jgi:hypothetical protein
MGELGIFMIKLDQGLNMFRDKGDRGDNHAKTGLSRSRYGVGCRRANPL